MSQVSQEQTSDAPLELESASPEVKSYQRRKILIKLISLVLSFVFLLLFALWIGPRLGPLLTQWVGESRWWQLIAVAAMVGIGSEIISIPLDFYSGYVLEHRFQLSNQTLGDWIIKRAKGYLVGIIISLPLLLGFYALLWFSGPYWWIWATIGWLCVSLLLGRIVPIVILPLFYKVTPLDDDDLRTRLEKLAEGTGLSIEGVYRLHLSKETKKANAALAGLGKSRRVLLGDTLLEEFKPEEIEVVFAHEVGHHVYRHLQKNIVWGLVTSVIAFWLVDITLRTVANNLNYQGFSDPAALPLVMLVLGLFGLFLAPLGNAVSRFFERQCDQYALDHTNSKEAYRSAFIKLAKLNKADPDPNPFVVWFFHDHPPIKERVGMAK